LQDTWNRQREEGVFDVLNNADQPFISQAEKVKVVLFS
jgi:hypothetical protein